MNNNNNMSIGIANDYTDRFILMNTPKELITSITSYCGDVLSHIKFDIIVAGGFIRSFFSGKEINDIDIYLTDINMVGNHLNYFENILLANDCDFAYESDTAFTYRKGKRVLQFMKIANHLSEYENFYRDFYRDQVGTTKINNTLLMTSLLSEFDFTICQCGVVVNGNSSNEQYNYTDNRIVCSDILINIDFFRHLAGRILVYTNNTEYPLSSLKRMIKYIKRGYNICDENLILIANSISEMVDFSNEDKLNEHIIGMDPLGERRIRAID
jgi:hypothetical protein